MVFAVVPVVHLSLQFDSELIRRLDDATQQNAAPVEESAAVAAAMQEQADRLARRLGVFKLNGNPSTLPTIAVAKVIPMLARKMLSSRIKQVKTASR